MMHAWTGRNAFNDVLHDPALAFNLFRHMARHTPRLFLDVLHRLHALIIGRTVGCRFLGNMDSATCE